MPMYSQILLNNSPTKPFPDFLIWLMEIDFYNATQERTTIKKFATGFKMDSNKVTKWIAEIYNGIFELNYEKPELFQRDGIKVELNMKYYDNYCNFSIAMPVLPREFETLHFPFAKGRIGMDIFWVKKVHHEINADTVATTLWLEGGFSNKYREFALEKALFQGWIGMMDEYQKSPSELDEILRKTYRH